MPRQFQISPDQTNATQRHDLEGAVYVLSGTLKGRRAGVADQAFRWSTLTFSGAAIGQVEAYIGPPATITRSQKFLPGEGGDMPAIRVPIRNLPFASGASLLTLIDDGVYAWEDSEASLRVAYLRPGQVASGLTAADFAFLIQDGFLGPPEEIDLDGFQVPLYSRGAMRNRAFRQPINNLAGDVLNALSGAMLKRDLGAIIPMVVGRPNTWYRPPTWESGVRGLTISAHSAGDKIVTFSLETEGGTRFTDAVTGQRLTQLYGTGVITLFGSPISGDVLFIHRQQPVYQIVPSGVVWNVSSGIVQVQLVSGLAADVPKGALVIEDVRYRRALSLNGFHNFAYSWIIAGHPMFDSANEIGMLSGNVGWLFPDGSVKVADPNVWRFELRQQAISGNSVQGFPNSHFPDGTPNSWTVQLLELRFGIDTGVGSHAADQFRDDVGTHPSTTPPVFFDTDFDATIVKQQPAFTSTQTLTKINYPTGGTGTNNALIRDGAVETGITLADSEVVTVTFNDAPAPFANGDTIESHLFIWAEGALLITDASGGTTFATIAQQGSVVLYRFTQSTPRAFNATIRMVGQAGGATIAEVWWEHTLSAAVQNTRTADVLIGGSSNPASGVVLGAPLEQAELVIRVNTGNGNDQLGRTYATRASGASLIGRFRVNDTTDPQFDITDPNWITFPPPVLLALQSYYLGPRFGSFLDVNSGSYQTAQERYTADNTRLGFVLNRKLESWSDLEQQFGLQTRSHVYYGPSGHEIVYQESASGFSASGVIQEFRLPGVPGANCMKASQRSLLERTRVDEIVNQALILWDEELVFRAFQKSTSARNQESINLFGTRDDPRGRLEFWAHAPFPENSGYTAEGVVSGIADFYAGRGAFSLTRFSIATAWVAHGVERGSPVRVVYQVAIDQDDDVAFRNVTCEVEEIRIEPGANEGFFLTLRATETPARGLPAFTWIDRFDDESDLWTDEIAFNDLWRDRWSI